MRDRVLMPVVSLSVALILFEGGLSLKLNELREIGTSVWNLVTIGVLITWIVTTAAAYYLLGLHFKLAILFLEVSENRINFTFYKIQNADFISCTESFFQFSYISFYPKIKILVNGKRVIFNS